MPQQATLNPIAMFFPFVAMFVIFYLLVFRPQNKERKAHQEMLKNLKKHDDVAIEGGILGTVVNVKPDTVTLRVDENVRLEVEKWAVKRLVKTRTDAKPEGGGP